MASGGLLAATVCCGWGPRGRAAPLTADGHVTPQLPLRPPRLLWLWWLLAVSRLAGGWHCDLAGVYAALARGYDASAVLVGEACCLGQAHRVAAPTLDRL